MIPALAAAFGASLLGSPHCVGMCGAFSSVHATRGRGAAWHLGRGAAYVVGGAIAGGVGGFAAELGWVGIGLMALMLVWFAARLAGFTSEGAAAAGSWAGRLQAKVVSWSTRLLRQGGVPAAAAFGALTALLPCGLLWGAWTIAAAAGSALAGAAVMGAFWSGTLPGLVAAGALVRRLTSGRLWVRRVVAAAVLVAGFGALGMRAQLEWRGDRLPEVCHGAAGP